MDLTITPVFFSISSHVSSSRFSPLADIKRSTPSLANASALPFPIPALPPLMIAFLPLIPKSMISPHIFLY